MTQILLVNWVHTEFGTEVWQRLHHSPNGGLRSRKTAHRMKMMGTRRGFHDLVLFYPRGGFNGFTLELKVGRGKPTPEQLEWRQYFLDCGFDSRVCSGITAAKQAFREYLH